MQDQSAREQIVDACRRMNDLGINQGTSGNISVRGSHGMLISPSSIPYERMTADDVVPVAFDGAVEGTGKPSSEWHFHLDILRQRPEFNAVVHAHPVHATAVAICRREIPPVHYMVAAAGGPTVRCATYHTFGTEALSASVLAALEGRNACLIANHGLVACGANLDRALWLAVEIETLAQQYVAALQIGDPVTLSETEIARVVEKFRDYGPRTTAD